MFHDRFVCMVMLAWCCVVRGEDLPATSVAESPAPEPTVVDSGDKDQEEPAPPPELLAAFKAAQDASDRIRQCRESLLATNDVIRALAAKVEMDRKVLIEFVQKSPVYHDVTQRIAVAEARIASLQPADGGVLGRDARKEVQTLREQMRKDRHQRRLMEMGQGVEGASPLSTALSDSLAGLQKGISATKEMGPLILAHNRAVAVYNDRLLEAASARVPSRDTAPPPPASPPPSDPALPSGSP